MSCMEGKITPRHETLARPPPGARTGPGGPLEAAMRSDAVAKLGPAWQHHLRRRPSGWVHYSPPKRYTGVDERNQS